jgi:exopolyphosphatase/guanosine-5'-triphosphate,3'-diphosphate pyrophosphatase
LGEGGINRGFITRDAWDRGITAIRKIHSVIQSCAVHEIRSFATSAIRNASNGLLFLKEIQSESGIIATVIDGNQEAEYIYYGVRQAIPIGIKPVLIMDIGGGSVEYIIANQHEIFWKRSFEIGAQRLYDLFHLDDPVRRENILNLNNYLELVLHPLGQALNKYQPESLIGCSGTFDTLREIYCLRKNLRKEKNKYDFHIDIHAFYSIHEEIISKNKAERLAIPGMSSMRADMIGMSSSLIYFILKKYPFTALKASSYSLKEGILSEIIDHAQIIEMSA